MAQKARRDRRPPSQIVTGDAEAVAGSEPFGADVAIGSGMETAVISDVTPAMMEEAAHRAAEAVETAADPSAIQAEHDHEAPSSEPALSPGVFAPSEHQTESRDATPSSVDDVADVMPVPAPSSIEASPVAAEVAIVGDVAASLAPDMPLPVDASSAETEAAEPTAEMSRRDLSSPGEAIGAYGAQIVEMVAANIAANGHFFTALMSATSVTDVMAVNTNHLRRQMELLTTQRRQLTTLARTMAFDAMKPFGASPTDQGRDLGRDTNDR